MLGALERNRQMSSSYVAYSTLPSPVTTAATLFLWERRVIGANSFFS